MKSETNRALAAKKKITNLFIYHPIDFLLRWANHHENRAFFIVLCDKYHTHVAFQNLDKLTCDGAATIGCEPELAAAWETIGVGVDACSEDLFKDPDWNAAANQLPHDSTSWRWKTFDFKHNTAGEYHERKSPTNNG